MARFHFWTFQPDHVTAVHLYIVVTRCGPCPAGFSAPVPSSSSDGSAAGLSGGLSMLAHELGGLIAQVGGCGDIPHTCVECVEIAA